MTRSATTILVVDDEYASLEVLGLLLEGEGFEVVSASDGEEAIDWLEKQHVDLVVTDYMMPKLSGLDLARRMLVDGRWSQVPLILVSAAFKLDEPLPGNVKAMLAKPLLFDSLLARIRELLAPAPVG